MKKLFRHVFWIAVVSVLLSACAGSKPKAAPAQPVDSGARILRELKQKYAPDHHLAVFDIKVQTEGQGVSLVGDVTDAAAKTATVAAFEKDGFKVSDQIKVLPGSELGETNCGIATLSVASGREWPGHGAELGTQILMGHAFSVLKQSNSWFLVQSEDRYLSWVQRGAFVRCAKERVEEWNKSPRLIVTAFEDRVLEKPQSGGQPISDVVTGCLVKKTGEDGEWFKVELPDGRAGYLAKSSAADYAEWKRTRTPTAEAIEQTSKTFMGRPYLWGGNSPKGLDCSGFTKLTFLLNGIDLNRNASQQVHQGKNVPLDAELSQLKKGDLIFFGSRRRLEDSRGGVTHVGIYLGDKMFIHSSEFVRVNSLDPKSPLADERRIRSLIYARRVLP